MTDTQTDPQSSAGWYQTAASAVLPLTPRAVDEPLPPSSKAPRLYTIAIVALSISVILALALAGLLAWFGKAVPDVIGSLGTICATALAALVGYKQGQGT